MLFNIDIVIFIGFLLANLLVGLRYGRSVKTIKSYALGERDFSTTALVATIVATWISGSMFFSDLSNVYSEGLSYIIPSLGFPLAFFIPALIFIPRMGEFMGKTSIAEAMGDIYGKNVQIIIAIAGAIGSAGTIAVQFKVFGSIFSYFLGMQGNIAIILAGLVATLYSAFGGIRAVTFTDVLQFFTFGCIIPLLGLLMWNHVCYDPTFSFASVFESEKFNFSSVLSLDNPELWGIISLFFYFSIPHMKPVWFQRVSMGRNLSQVKTAFIISGFLILFITLSIAWIPFLLYAIDPNIEASYLLGYIIEHFSAPGFKGVLMIALTAMALSTADSYMNASAVLFANDFCKPLGIGKDQGLFLSKIFSLGIGLLAITLTFITSNLLKMVLLANSFYVPVVTAPVMLTILGFRSSTTSVLIGMSAGLFVMLLWKVMGFEMDGIVISMLVNTLFLIGSHYLLKQPGGWVNHKKNNYTQIKKRVITIKLTKFLNLIRSFNFIKFCKKTAPKNELMYMGLGIYCIFYTFTTMYSTHVELLRVNGRIILGIYQIMMVTGTLMAMYPIWPPRIKKEIIVQVAWNIVIFYMLVFFSCFFVMVSNFGHLQFAAFTINVLITALLLGWKLAVGMIVIGFYLSIQFYKYYAGVNNLEIDLGSPLFLFMYCLMLVGSALIIFLKPKEEYLEKTELKVETLETEVTHLSHEVTDLNEQVSHYSERIADQNQEIERLGATAQKILNNVNHELRLPIGNVMNFSDMLNEALEKTDNKLVQMLSKEVYDNSNRVSSMILNMLDLATLEVKKVDLQKTIINFSELVADRVKSCRKIYLQNKKIDFELTIEPEIMVAVDPNYMRQTVDNLVINAINFSEKGLIKVSVLRKDREVQFIISDQGKGIPKGEEYDIFTPFKMGSNTESKALGRGVGLALCRSAVEAHGGSIKAESNGEEGASFTFMLPL